MSIMIQGTVEHGDARGRLLGFPTANLRLPSGNEADGVWAAHVLVLGGGSWHATVSIGTRPTYYEADSIRLAESYLLGFDGDLYGRKISVELVHRLRQQIACDSSSQLVQLIRDDVARTRAFFAEQAAETAARVGNESTPLAHPLSGKMEFSPAGELISTTQ